jgi:hypothetical protein
MRGMVAILCSGQGGQHLESYHRCAPQHPSAGTGFCCTQSCSYGEPSLIRSDRLVNG